MARVSQWQKYKEEVCEQLRSGVGTTALQSAYPQIPEGTIKSWARAVRSSLNPDLNQSQSATVSAVEVLSPHSNISTIEGAGSTSDFALARRTLRNIARDLGESGGVRVQASLGLLKMTAMRFDLPKHILDEIEESNLNEERDRIATASPAELARRYREALG